MFKREVQERKRKVQAYLNIIIPFLQGALMNEINHVGSKYVISAPLKLNIIPSRIAFQIKELAGLDF